MEIFEIIAMVDRILLNDNPAVLASAAMIMLLLFLILIILILRERECEELKKHKGEG